MSGVTLTEFLLARIAEDEAVARKASHQKVAGPFHGDWRSDSAAMMSAPLFDEADRKHIARHDPARVLAECEAKRRIVEMGRFSDSPESAVDYWLDEGKGLTASPGLGAMIDVFRALASVYADHPDYDEAWRL